MSDTTEYDRLVDIIQSGYAGLDRKGLIVDRREQPKAVPIKENAMMGTPAPKKVEDAN